MNLFRVITYLLVDKVEEIMIVKKPTIVVVIKLAEVPRFLWQLSLGGHFLFPLSIDQCFHLFATAISHDIGIQGGGIGKIAYISPCLKQNLMRQLEELT